MENLRRLTNGSNNGDIKTLTRSHGSRKKRFSGTLVENNIWKVAMGVFNKCLVSVVFMQISLP